MGQGGSDGWASSAGEIRMADLTACVGKGPGLLGMATPAPRLEDQTGERPSAVAALLPRGVLGMEGKCRCCGNEGATGIVGGGLGCDGGRGLPAQQQAVLPPTQCLNIPLDT